jgi:TolB-like protein/Flp pilus assembly protein TadD
MQATFESGISTQTVRKQIEKILQSSFFSDSQRMARFLSFAVEETLNGNGSRLKEVVIGTEVFDRQAAYDPRIDPIVRVEARRLRAKLHSYYDGEGEYDPVVVEFPKGGYSPVFHLRLQRSPNEVTVPPQTNTFSRDNTIVVLPFTNLNPENDGDYFSDGLSEELIHALTRIEGLMVVAWSSAAQLRERQQDFGVIRQRLDVAHVLRGSIRRTGERLRISAQLIETLGGRYVWSETYDRQLRDVFAIQAEIATAIATALKLRFSNDESPRPQGQRDIEVYQLCLKGRFHARERTEEGLKRSIICFEQAICRDNNSDSAYAGLADAYTLMAEYAFAESRDCMLRAKAAAQKALELNPLSAEAHTSLGLMLALHDWSWNEAAIAFKRALAINPGYAQAHHWYATDYLAMLGRFEEACEHIETAVKLDPLSPIILENRAFLEVLRRRYDDAIGLYLQLLELDPSFYKAYTSLGRAYLQSGSFDKAIEMLQKGRALVGDMPTILGALGQAHGLAGHVADAREFLHQLEKIASARPVPATCFALVHLGMGDKEAALTWLERGVDGHQSNVIGLKVHPIYDDLREDPRFHAMLRKMGLAG